MPIEIESPEQTGYDRIACNLAESSVADLSFSDLSLSLNHIVLGYSDHLGKKELRQLIAEPIGMGADQVLITTGAAAALFMLHTVLLGPSDHLVVLRPNYASNIEVPRAIGCSITYIDLQFESSWKPDLEKIRAAIRPSTKLISITTPHNPTGMVIAEKEIDALVQLVEERDIFLLVDETYRDTCFPAVYPPVAGKSMQVISVASLSKAFGLPGVRTGWLLSRHPSLFEKLLAAKEMIYITNAVLEEEISYQFLLQKQSWSDKINKKAMQNYDVLRAWLEREKRLECVLPRGGVVCFPRFKKEIPADTSVFYRALMDKYQTMVGPGHWFEVPDSYMRIGFGWVKTELLQKGLQNISLAIDDCLR